MWQNTLATPGRVKVHDRLEPEGNRPRSNVAPRDRENTLWKNGSWLGNATEEPAVTATRCGANCSSFCAIDAFIGAAVGPPAMSEKKITTLCISGRGFARGATPRRS
jgi:hypothetical protein